MTSQLDFHTAIQEMLDPYVLAPSARVVVTQEFGGLELVQIDAMLKPRQLPEEPTSSQARTALMDSANQIIGLLEDFGFRPFGTAPRIEFGGQMVHRFDGDSLVVTEARISLTLLPPKA